MDSIFGIGFPELIVILLLAGIVMGPQRIRQVARWLGAITAKLQTISRGFMRQLNSELDSIDEDGELRGAMEEVRSLRRQVDDLRRELTASTSGAVAEGKAALSEGKAALEESERALNQSILPPDLATLQQENGRSHAEPPNSPPAAAAAADSEAAAESSPPVPAKLPSVLEVPDDPE